MFVKLLLGVVLVEAITQLLCKSEIIKPIREFFFERRQYKFFKFIHDLLDCGYCTSFWIGFMVSCSWYFINNIYVDVLFLGLILHRLSNVVHFLIDYLDMIRSR